MCSLRVAILTAALLQVKTFVWYPRHYDQEVLPGEVQMFFKSLAPRSYLCKFAFIGKLYLFHILIVLKHLMLVSSMWPIGPLVFSKQYEIMCEILHVAFPLVFDFLELNLDLSRDVVNF